MPKPSAGRKHDDQERQPGREDRYEWIRIEKILLPKSDETLDEKTVAVIAESILVFDLLQPIGVRRVTEKRKDGEIMEKITLAFGAHRLEAMKRLGRKEIPCFYVEGDETDAQLVRLGENLWRKRTSVLRDAERLVEYFKFASAKLSGQPVRKSKFGRPPGGTALAARELPVIGRSVEARRQIIRRAKKIAQISPEAKKAAIKARLQNNQQALLKIAKAGGQKAQLRMVAELAEISKELRAPRNRAAKRSRAEGDTSTAATVRSSLQAGANEIAADADDAPAEATGNHRPAHKTATLEEMVSLWEPECRARWAYFPSEDRERFIEIIRRARRRARVDVVEFLKDVFRGRQKVSKQDLFGIAAMHGFATSTIRKALKGLGYRTKRKGHGRGAKWFVINPDRRWEKYLPVISDAELKAAVEAQPDPRDTAAADDGWDSRAAADYLEDL